MTQQFFITTYDPFDKKRMVYTIKNSCTEEPELPCEDGARTIFLFTRGVNGNPPADLVELLRYMEDTTEKNVCNERIRKLHEMVQHTKKDAKAGVAYMKWYEIESMCREDGRKAGELVVISIIRNLVRQNQSAEDISEITGLPSTVTKEIVEQLNRHPEWDNERILAGFEKLLVPECQKA